MTKAREAGSFAIVARLKAEAERQAAEALGVAQRRLADEEARLESVRGLLAEYQDREHVGGAQLKQLREARSFLERLRGAVQAQTDAVEQQRRVTESARAHWVSAKMQRDAIDRLVEERAAAEGRRLERIEQRQVDDRVARQEPDLFTGTLV
ncbi:MAG: flagellar FliJ family protein [Gammaproteobacteria bacterium]|nr:flagellar FliJ family protein [Gammaproteobacteria bacterium]